MTIQVSFQCGTIRRDGDNVNLWVVAIIDRTDNSRTVALRVLCPHRRSRRIPLLEANAEGVRASHSVPCHWVLSRIERGISARNSRRRAVKNRWKRLRYVCACPVDILLMSRFPVAICQGWRDKPVSRGFVKFVLRRRSGRVCILGVTAYHILRRSD